MRLITCPGKDKNGKLGHPCGKAGNALREAGHDYELTPVKGMKMLPWTRRGDARKEVRELTGQEDVPVLVLDDGTTIAGSGNIVEWARTNSRA